MRAYLFIPYFSSKMQLMVFEIYGHIA